MMELNLTNESFALVGERDQSPQCVDCGHVGVFLVQGVCEPCMDARAQALIEAEAMQNTLFGRTV